MVISKACIHVSCQMPSPYRVGRSKSVLLRKLDCAVGSCRSCHRGLQKIVERVIGDDAAPSSTTLIAACFRFARTSPRE
jgi:hypothetical protein